MLVCQLLLSLVLLPLSVLAAKDEKTPAAARSIEKTVNLRTHSIYAPYIDQDLQNRWWDFGGDTYINTNKHIRLTRNRPSQMGWLWSRLPITASSYVIEVEFKISGDSSHLFGDGMALWLTRTRAVPGPVFGSKDKFDGFAVFIDTYSNGRHSYSFPRVTAMLGDGKTEYDHANDGEKNSIGACSASLRRTNVGTKMRLTYVKDTYVELKLQYKAWNDWTPCFRIENVTLPVVPYLGFSALTGDVFDSHDIIAVSTSTVILADPAAPRDKFRAPESSSSGSFFGTLFKLILFVGVCVGAVYGYQTYTRQRGGGFGGGLGGGLGGRRGYGNDLFSGGKRF